MKYLIAIATALSLAACAGTPTPRLYEGAMMKQPHGGKGRFEDWGTLYRDANNPANYTNAVPTATGGTVPGKN